MSRIRSEGISPHPCAKYRAALRVIWGHFNDRVSQYVPLDILTEVRALCTGSEKMKVG
jgi:hypothetical protein